MAISYQALALERATFYINGAAESGKPCKIASSGTVEPCEKSDEFFGIIESVRGGLACVVYRGFVTVPYTGTVPTVGYGQLCSGEGASVEVASDAQTYLIVNVDTTAQTVTFLL